MTLRSRPPRPFRAAVLRALIAAGLLFAPGCGRSTCTVSGRVYLNDQPVTAGSIAMFCEGDRTVRGHIGPDGSYSIPNVPAGGVRVAVYPLSKLPAGMGRKYAPLPVVNDGPVIPTPGRAANDAKAPALPKRYGVPEESGLTFRTNATDTTFDLRLTR